MHHKAFGFTYYCSFFIPGNEGRIAIRASPYPTGSARVCNYGCKQKKKEEGNIKIK